MIPIKYIKDEELETDFWEYIRKRHNKANIDELDDKCEQYFECSFEKIVLMEPVELEAFKKEMDDRPDLECVVSAFRNIHPRKGVVKDNNYVYQTLYKGLPSDIRKRIFKNTHISTCPYCNRNFIEELPENSQANGNQGTLNTTFELDHFYSESSYPMLAVSLYNLIPVCHVCNRIKLTSELKLYPYRISEEEENYRFSFDINGNNFLNNTEDISIILTKQNQQAENDAAVLHLQERYNLHKDYVQEIIKKTRYFGKDYANGLMNVASGLFEDEKEIFRMLFGGYADSKSYGRRPLSKFIHDIYEEAEELLK
jgi:5-methylcytosine-specific restriction endonuclease McrA